MGRTENKTDTRRLSPEFPTRGHGACVAVAFFLCAGCATVRPTSPAGQKAVGDTTVSATAQWPSRVPGDSPGTGTQPAPTSPLAPDTTRDQGPDASYVIPAAEILGFEILLNRFDRYTQTDDAYRTSFSSIKRNLHRGWIIDDDPFAMNQFMHPYQGSVYHGFARSAGLGYWESLGYDVVGSALWEVAGETGPPSLNDQITTSFGGSFLGEAFFRMASHLLETGDESPGFFRNAGAALISPPTGFNRLAFGDRFDAVFPSHDPATYTRVGIGVRRNSKQKDVGDVHVPQDEVVADFVMDYGLPGKPGYEYSRPFDYFHFEATAASSTHTLPEDVMIRGLLCGSKYDEGDSYRGIWGLYGGYDYISPEVFSVSSTSLSLGTTAQWRLSDAVALQGTCLGGVGWTAAGTIAHADTDRDYQYGVSPQGLVALRVLFGDVAVLDMTGRDYHLGVVSSGRNKEESEDILRGKVALTVRVYGHHALGIQYVASSRDVRFTDLPDTHQSIGAVSLFYTYIFDTKFGAVD
jgi:hypothetical protein